MRSIAFFIAAAAFADSRLPRPAKSEPSASTSTPQETKPDTKAAQASEVQVSIQTCHSEFTSQVHPRIAVDGQNIYYLARQSVAEKDLFQYELFKMLPSGHKKSVFKTIGPHDIVLIPHQRPVEGFSFLSLSEPMGYCSGGRGEGVTIPTRKTTQKRALSTKTFQDATYHWFESTQGRLLQDLSKMFVRTIDPGSMQHRVLYQVSKGAQVLYWDARKQISYQWLGNPKRLLTKTSGQGQKNLVEVSIPNGLKLVQDEDRFGVVEYNSAENLMRIMEVTTFATKPSFREHRIRLPQGMFIDQADLYARFPTQFAVITQSPQRESTWGKILLFRFDKGLMSELLIPKDTRVAGIQLTSSPEVPVFVFLESTVTKLHQSVKMWNANRGIWTDH